MTQKIEFLNEDELCEYFEGGDIKIISKRNTNNGILVEYETNSTISSLEEKEQDKLVLFTYYGNSKMYYGKKGSTFQKSEAKIFTKEQANDKIKFMNSCYDWKIEPY